MQEKTLVFRDGDVFAVSDEAILKTLDIALADKRRASHIEPVNRLLRVAFHSIRMCVSDDSEWAQWTRAWPCRWRVNVIGGRTWGSYADRQEAIDDEVAHLVEQMSSEE